jgi:hypothetical protein
VTPQLSLTAQGKALSLQEILDYYGVILFNEEVLRHPDKFTKIGEV